MKAPIRKKATVSDPPADTKPPEAAASDWEKGVRDKVTPPPPPDNSLSEIDPEDPKGSASRRFLSEDGATCGELGITELEVTWGGEKFSPVQFMTFDVGPITIRVKCEPNERVNQVYRRTYDLAKRYGEQQFAQKLPEHIDRVKRSAAATDRKT